VGSFEKRSLPEGWQLRVCDDAASWNLAQKMARSPLDAFQSKDQWWITMATELLRKAFERASEKLPDSEQDALAEWLLNFINADGEWDKVLADSQDQLERMADEALKAYQAGETEILDPSKL
jgi:hypothetical protein